jgi:hypothetical protein
MAHSVADNDPPIFGPCLRGVYTAVIGQNG